MTGKIGNKVTVIYRSQIWAWRGDRMVMFAMSQPEDVDINEILFRPTAQDL